MTNGGIGDDAAMKAAGRTKFGLMKFLHDKNDTNDAKLQAAHQLDTDKGYRRATYGRMKTALDKSPDGKATSDDLDENMKLVWLSGWMIDPSFANSRTTIRDFQK